MLQHAGLPNRLFCLPQYVHRESGISCCFWSRVPVRPRDKTITPHVFIFIHPGLKTKVFASSSPPPQSGMPGRPGSPVSLAGRGDGRNGGSGGGEADDAARLAEMAAHNVILEVAAYPAGLFSPPETGEREHLQRNPRAEGRRRVVLTAESLWKRRRSMHPKVFLSEKPPLKLSGWLERDSRDAHAPSGTGAPDQAGNAEGAVEEGAENGKAGAEGSVGDGREAGDVGERGMGRKAQEDALDDLVNMVAFGPVDDREGRPKGALQALWSVWLHCDLERRDCRLGRINVCFATERVPLSG